MDQQRRRKEAYARREAEVDLTRSRLERLGRVPLRGIARGNVRTYLWANHKDKSVPTCVEQIRLFSTIRDWGTTRTMEASDLVHVMSSLTAAAEMIGKAGRHGARPRDLGKGAVLRAVSRGDNPPSEVFTSGNVAALLWVNEVLDGADAVFKVELLTLHEEFGDTDRFFVAAQIDDAKRCYADANRALLAIQRKLHR